MSNVIYLNDWKRARLGGFAPPIDRRARPRTRRRETHGGFISIGKYAADIVKRLE